MQSYTRRSARRLTHYYPASKRVSRSVWIVIRDFCPETKRRGEENNSSSVNILLLVVTTTASWKFHERYEYMTRVRRSLLFALVFWLCLWLMTLVGGRTVAASFDGECDWRKVRIHGIIRGALCKHKGQFQAFENQYMVYCTFTNLQILGLVQSNKQINVRFVTEVKSIWTCNPS